MKMRIFLELLLGFLAVCSVAILASLFFAAPAQSQDMPENCTSRTSALEELQEKYDEAPTVIGVTNGGGLMELLQSPGGETWTILLSTPKGISCFIGAGEGLRFLELKSTDPGA